MIRLNIKILKIPMTALFFSLHLLLVRIVPSLLWKSKLDTRRELYNESKILKNMVHLISFRSMFLSHGTPCARKPPG